MLAKITLYDGTIYRIADKTTDTEDGIYLGRIKDELSLVSAMQEAGNAPATINLTIINDDDFIPHSKDLWAAEVLLTNENNISWRGKINFCNFDSDGNLYVTASEKTAPELELQLPDEVRQVYTIDEDFHQSSVTMTIPLVIGGTTSNPILLPTILIDKTEGVYLICVGEIRSIVKVYNGTEELPNTAYTAYTGTASQAEHAGFAYVKINEDYRLNADGSYAEINVEVVGLKLGNFTEEECRNGALFLYYFLTTAATGINGWGCGIDQSEIDTASFQSAITLCNQLGYKLDGIMWLRQSAQSWIDQICQAIHGKYSINANGKRSLFIDYAGNASEKTFTASNMQVDKYGKNSYTSVVYNKGILSYDYNPITGLFMQSAQYENAESIAQIGEQKFVGESYLLKDPTTALAVLEYTCKRSQTAAEAIEFKTDDVETNLRAGDIITINRPDLNLNNALYQIQSISITDFQAQITAQKFDTSVFNVTGTASSVNWGNERDITPALTPAQATNLLLSTGFDINPDGTGTPYISGTFTVPDGGWLAAAVQYGIGSSPSNWTELALITEGRFKISPVNVGTVYSIRVRMITPTGHSDYITGQITATGDSTPPLAPTITAKATDKTVTIQCGLDNPPYDMGGFQIYRKKSTESVYTLIGSVAANRGYASITDYVDEYITYNYQAKSYDRSGNLSTNFSNTASVTVTGIQANDVAATALAMPTGSILRLSAKNCTTSSIAEANGVKDVSGRGNHGQAFGGVTVLDGGEGFEFDGIDDYVLFNSNSVKSSINGRKSITITGTFCVYSLTDTTKNIITIKTSATSIGLMFRLFPVSNVLKLQFGGRVKSSDSSITDYGNVSIEANKEYDIAVVGDAEHGKCHLYIDGVLNNTIESWNTGLFDNTHSVTLGCQALSKNFFNGIIKNVRIYPRALSASEIKTIYMFPDDVTFGQLTSDLIGANIIKAENLIKTESLITTVAQIDQAVVDNLNVVGNATFQSTLNSAIDDIEVGGRNLLKSTSSDEISFETAARNYNPTNYAKLNVKSATELTISFEAKASTSRWIDFYFSNSSNTYAGESYFYPFAQLTTSYQRFVVTDTAGIDLTDIPDLRIRQSAGKHGSASTGATIYIKNLKLEVGNKATSWTPAPEDVDASIDSAESNAISTAAADATTKANNARTNAVADSKAYADTELAKKMAIADYCYNNDTTFINGGKIYAGTVTANQIAANAITAEKLSVVGFPKGMRFGLSWEGCPNNSNYTAVGAKVPEISGNDYKFEIAGAAYSSIYHNDATNNGYLIYSGARSAKSIDLVSGSIVFPASFTLFMRVRHEGTDEDLTDMQVLFFAGVSPSNLANAIQIHMTTARKLGISTWNSEGTRNNVITDLTLNRQSWYNLGFIFNGSTGKVDVYNGVTLVGSYTNTHTASLTASRVRFCNARNDMLSATYNWIGYVGYCLMYGYNLGAEMTKYLAKSLQRIDQVGRITAERIATDAIRGRDASGGGDGSYTTQGIVMNLSGKGWLSTQKCSISSSGVIKAKDVDLTGKITATSGSIGGFLLQNGMLLGAGSDTSSAFMGLDYSTSSYQYTSTFNCGNIQLEYWTISSNTKYIANRTELMSNMIRMRSFSNGQQTSQTAIGSSNVSINVGGSNTAEALLVTGKVVVNGSVVHGSDENIKTEIKDVSTLEKLKKIRIKSWKYDEEKINQKEYTKELEQYSKGDLEEKPVLRIVKSDYLKEAPTHIGAMAGEFNEAFGTGNNSKDFISYTDEIGVALRAIQELAAEVDELKAKLKIQQDSKSDVEQEASYTEKPDNSKNADNLDFADIGKMVENQQQEQK